MGLLEVLGSPTLDIASEMAPQLRSAYIKSDVVQAALANLVQEGLQDPNSLFKCSADSHAWTPARFKAALASAAKGDTLALQSNWLTPIRLG